MAHNMYQRCGPPSVFSLCQIIESGNHSNPFFCVCRTSANMINSIQLKVITSPRLGRSLYPFVSQSSWLSAFITSRISSQHSLQFSLKKKKKNGISLFELIIEVIFCAIHLTLFNAALYYISLILLGICLIFPTRL